MMGEGAFAHSSHWHAKWMDWMEWEVDHRGEGAIAPSSHVQAGRLVEVADRRGWVG